MHPYIIPLSKSFKKSQNESEAARIKAYLKGQFDYFGIKTEKRRELCKRFIEQYGLPDEKDLNEIALNLFNQPQREFHYFAIELLLLFKKQWKVEMIELFEKLILKNSWWDSVDFISISCVGFYSQQFPSEAKKKIGKWNKSKNMWLNRTSIIYQNNLKLKTDTRILFSNIKKHTHSDEFFIQKAIGWALRQHARTDAKAVSDFCRKTKLKPLSYREAMKHIVE
ncbi:MAG: DNA alkylation repair protein [Bacteroidia bacterium]